jgi:hypothetical protein
MLIYFLQARNCTTTNAIPRARCSLGSIGQEGNLVGTHSSHSLSLSSIHHHHTFPVIVSEKHLAIHHCIASSSRSQRCSIRGGSVVKIGMVHDV